jgi:hypothetical protein
MDVVWSREFQVALLCFLTPMALAAGLVYRRVWKSDLRRRRKRIQVTQASVRRVLEQSAPPVVAVAAPAKADPQALHSLQQPLENLRQCLVEFRTSIQQSRSALGTLQECDCRFSVDLNRASELMHHAFTK